MSQDANIDSLVKDPSLLVELINEVIDHLSSGQDESSMAEMEAQLREVAKAIDNLDKVGVSVPDVLRAEKTRIVAKLSIHTEVTEALSRFTDELEQIVNNLKKLGANQQKKSRTIRTIPLARVKLMVNEILENSTDPLYGPNVLSFSPLFNAVLNASNGTIKPNERHKVTAVLIGLGFTKLTRCRLPIDSNKDNRHALWAKVPENIDSDNALSWAIDIIESGINKA